MTEFMFFCGYLSFALVAIVLGAALDSIHKELRRILKSIERLEKE